MRTEENYPESITLFIILLSTPVSVTWQLRLATHAFSLPVIIAVELAHGLHLPPRLPLLGSTAAVIPELEHDGHAQGLPQQGDLCSRC